jgi:hypothetical protein
VKAGVREGLWGVGFFGCEIIGGELVVSALEGRLEQRWRDGVVEWWSGGDEDEDEDEDGDGCGEAAGLVPFFIRRTASVFEC